MFIILIIYVIFIVIIIIFIVFIIFVLLLIVFIYLELSVQQTQQRPFVVLHFYGQSTKFLFRHKDS